MDKLLELPYFNLVMVMQTKGITEHNARVWLSRQSKVKKIIRLTNGIYMGRDYYLKNKDNETFVGLVSSIINPHSYLSGEWVLQKYGVMTEGIFNITSVSTKHTREIVNPIGRFLYNNVSSKVFEGYTETNIDGIIVREASCAKALYDYFYLRKMPEGIMKRNYSIIEDVRLNLSHLNNDFVEEFEGWVGKYQSPKMIKIFHNIRRLGWE